MSIYRSLGMGGILLVSTLVVFGLQAATYASDPVIEVGKDAEGKPLHTFCMNRDGNILAGCGGNRTEFDYVGGASRSKDIVEQGEIRVYSPAGELVDVWNVEVTPRAIAVAPDGTIFVAGQGRMAKLNAKGETLLAADTSLVRNYNMEQEAIAKAEAKKKEEEAAKKEAEKEQEKPKPVLSTVLAKLLGLPTEEDAIVDEEFERQQAAMRVREVNAIAASESDVFLACPMIKGYGYAVWRIATVRKDSAVAATR